MKRYRPYHHIRKSATILGLELVYFSIFMFGVVFSLLVIIFSFRFSLVIALFGINALTYLGLLLHKRLLQAIRRRYANDFLITGKYPWGYGI
ncbi:hypothetical protein D3A96_10295 [Robertkochia marina]|nr:hypothetical protein D3A96_10295 [Robertkochia marina]